jgi:hypothetical protein
LTSFGAKSTGKKLSGTLKMPEPLVHGPVPAIQRVPIPRLQPPLSGVSGKIFEKPIRVKAFRTGLIHHQHIIFPLVRDLRLAN